MALTRELNELTCRLGKCAELDGMRTRAAALAEVFGSEGFAERMKRQEAAIAAIHAGFVRRELFVARAIDASAEPA